MAEMRLSAKRAKDLGDKIEQIEAEEGKPSHGLRRSQQAESSFRDQLSKELAAEIRLLEIVRQVASSAASQALAPETILLPSVPDFDPSQLGFGFDEVHEFALMHTLVKETQILPATIMEIPFGVEEHHKAIVREILRANDIAEIAYRLSPSAEKEMCIRVGDALLREYPEPSRFQLLVEGMTQLESALVEMIEKEVSVLLAASPSPRRIGTAA